MYYESLLNFIKSEKFGTVSLIGYVGAFDEITDAPDGAASPFSIDIGATFVGSIDSGYDEDWVSVTLEAGQAYQVTVTSLDGSLDPEVSMLQYYDYGPHYPELSYYGHFVENNDSGVGDAASVIFTASKDGVHFIEISSEHPYNDETGAYQVHVAEVTINDTAGNQSADAYALTLGEVYEGGIDFGGTADEADTDWFSIDLDAGVGYNFALDLEGFENPTWTLYDADMNAVDSGSFSFPGLRPTDFDFTPDVGGTYYLEVESSLPFEHGNYSLTVTQTSSENDDEGHTMADAADMAVGEDYAGTLDHIGDTDFIRVTLDAGNAYTITLTEGTASLNDLMVLHSDTDIRTAATEGETPAVQPGGALFHDVKIVDGVATVTINPVETGDYFIAVSAANPADLGTYSVNVEVAPEGVSAAESHDQLATLMTDGFMGAYDRRDGEADIAHAHDFTANETIRVSFTDLSYAEQGTSIMALQAWSAATGLNFEILSDDEVLAQNAASPNYDINIATHTSGGLGVNNAAIAGFNVENDGSIGEGSVKLSPGWLDQYGTDFGTFGYYAMIHEIGHALGLGHTGNYNGSDGNFSDDALQYLDSWQTSVMSYFAQSDGGEYNVGGVNPNVDASYAIPLTPMIADILAIEELYGHIDVKLGDDVYDYGIIASIVAEDGARAVTIRDDGGYDVLNLSAATDDNRVTLAAETHSDVDGYVGNLTMSRGTVVEGYIGGTASDHVTGNEADNYIDGGAGNDTLLGEAGADTLLANGGNDELYGGADEDVFDIQSSGSHSIYGGADGDDQDSLDLSEFVEDVDYTLNQNGEDGTVTFTATGDVLTFADIETIVKVTPQEAPEEPIVVTFNGTDDADQIVVGDVDADDDVVSHNGNTIMTEGGDDSVRAGTGDDEVYGATGNDVILGGEGHDRLYGGADDDILIAGDDFRVNAGQIISANAEKIATDLLEGGAGNDTLLASDGGNDVIYGGSGEDEIVSSGMGNISVYAGTDNDRVDVISAGHNVDAGEGDDIITIIDDFFIIQDGTTHVDGNAGNDTLDLTNFTDEEISVSYTSDTSGTVTFAESGRTVTFENVETLDVLEGDGSVHGTDEGDFIAVHTNYVDPQGDRHVDGQDATIYGLGGDDTIFDSDEDDLIYGGSGDDSVNAGTGTAVVYGESGNDTLYAGDVYDDETTPNVYGGSGDDDLGHNGSGTGSVYGGVGDDRIGGGKGINYLYSGDGHDAISAGSDGTHHIDAGTGNDSIDVLSGEIEDLQAGAGDDGVRIYTHGIDATDLANVFGGAGQDTLRFDDDPHGQEASPSVSITELAAQGFETFIGTVGDEYVSVSDTSATTDDFSLSGDFGNDTMIASDGDDSIYGGFGDDNLQGGAGDDYLSSTQGADSIYGGGGNDTINGGYDATTLYGEPGGDELYGGSGDDVIYNRESSNDALYGGAGNDSISTRYGDDTVDGGDGDDVINTGIWWDLDENGTSLLTGGAGADTFTFMGLTSVNTVTDFDPTEDSIDIMFLLGRAYKYAMSLDGVGVNSAEVTDGEYSSQISIVFRQNGDDVEIRILHNGQDVSGDGAFVTLLNVDLNGVSTTDVFDAGTLERISNYSKYSLDWTGDAANNGGVLGAIEFTPIIRTVEEATIVGDETDDEIQTFVGISDLSGGAGSDYIRGGIQADILNGGDGNDLIIGDVSTFVGASDQITAGTGNDIISGGFGADTFIFKADEGTNTIARIDTQTVQFDAEEGYSATLSGADFQAGIDKIQLVDFSTVNAANVMSFITDESDGATFSAENTTVVFHGITSSTLTESDFVFG